MLAHYPSSALRERSHACIGYNDSAVGLVCCAYVPQFIKTFVCGRVAVGCVCAPRTRWESERDEWRQSLSITEYCIHHYLLMYRGVIFILKNPVAALSLSVSLPLYRSFFLFVRAFCVSIKYSIVCSIKNSERGKYAIGDRETETVTTRTQV